MVSEIFSQAGHTYSASFDANASWLCLMMPGNNYDTITHLPGHQRRYDTYLCGDVKMWKRVVLEWVHSVSAQLQPQSCCISSDSLPCQVLWVVSFAPLWTPQCFGQNPIIAPIVTAWSILVYIIVSLPGPRAPSELNILFIFASAVPRIIWGVK